MSERIVAKVEGKVKLFHFKVRKDYGSRISQYLQKSPKGFRNMNCNKNHIKNVKK
ncbi:hypothetical protein HMPREF2738_02752 [Clostridiales bacterium KLE1615]|nr:hypothetical protein HMPREF2738_02752 [Clostridiales bacterium KLE1615]